MGATDKRSNATGGLKKRRRSSPAIRRRARRAAEILHVNYGSPDHGNKSDPLDELVFIVLSQMTTGPSYNRVYDRLKQMCPEWSRLIDMPLAKLKRLIRDAGLSGQKAPRLRTIVRRLKLDFGAVTLAPLSAMGDQEAEQYLTSLPGIGTKTAKCILMYAMERQVLPVDTHVWRLARRLGLVEITEPYSNVHEALERVVPPTARYSLHVNGIAHGRKVCLALRPKCESCILRKLCRYASQRRGTRN